MPETKEPRPTEQVAADLLQWCSNYFGNPPSFQALVVELLASLQPPPPTTARLKP